MKELFSSLPRQTTADWLVDTCFLYWVFINQHEKKFITFCTENSVALSSFTVEEVLYHAHDVPHQFRERFRHALKQGLNLTIIEVPVHPGSPSDEITYVHSIDPELIQLVPDHSDAVIAALAKKIHANMLTRDKHHLFTVELENYFSKQGITVQNNM